MKGIGGDVRTKLVAGGRQVHVAGGFAGLLNWMHATNARLVQFSSAAGQVRIYSVGVAPAHTCGGRECRGVTGSSVLA